MLELIQSESLKEGADIDDVKAKYLASCKCPLTIFKYIP
jgi:hypothetical protein